MDSSQRALQTNGKLFQISESFFELTAIFYNNSGLGLGLCKRGGGGICADQHTF